MLKFGTSAHNSSTPAVLKRHSGELERVTEIKGRGKKVSTLTLAVLLFDMSRLYSVQVKALEASFAQDPEPPGEEVDRLRSETKMTRREIHSWFTERRKRVAAEKKREEAERVMQEEDEEEMEAVGEERQKEDSSGELKVNPIKINLKMLKVTKANGKAEGEGSDSSALSHQSSSTPVLSRGPNPSQSSTPTPKPAQSPKPTTIRTKKTVEQLEMLKQVYVRTQWPSATQYDELISATGLPRPEVVRWFGDSRYMQKNGQLKWLEAYQNMALEEDLQKGNVQVLHAHLDVYGRLEESQVFTTKNDVYTCYSSSSILSNRNLSSR